MSETSSARIHYATCGLDCPSACALEVSVTEGRVTRVRGWPDHPFTQGTICHKVARYDALVHGPRIEHPLLRDGAKGRGQFRPVSWDQALAHVAAELRRLTGSYGPEAVLPFYFGGTMGVVQQRAIERLAHHQGWSRLGRTLCSSVAAAGWRAGVGRLLGPAPQEIADSDLVVLWGCNPVSTHINLMRFVAQARRRGAELVVVDPYRTRSARSADRHLSPRPGSDGALACAIMSVLFTEGFADRSYLRSHTDLDADVEAHLRSRDPEWAAPITGLEAAQIRDLARRYGEARRPFIRVGVGMSRHFNGAVNVHAVSCLPSVTGAWRRSGAGALLGTDDAFALDTEPVRQRAWLRPETRILDMSQIGRWLTDRDLDPQLKALVVFNANPAGSCPDLSRVRLGLEREDLFTVVHEQVMSDTARYADVLLPATSFLEHPDLYKSYGQYTLQLAMPCLKPRAGSRCNHDVVNALARCLDVDDTAFSGDSLEMIDRVLAASKLPPRSEFERVHWLDCAPPEAERHFDAGFPQDDGRFHFRPGWRDAEMPPLPDHWPVNSRDTAERARQYPLDFMSPPSHQVLNTTFTLTPGAARSHTPPRLMLHPDDAASRGIGDGDRVVVRNERARLTLTAQVTDEVRPGLCLCESNHLAASFPEGLSINALADARPVAPDGGAAFHDNRVQVERAS